MHSNDYDEAFGRFLEQTEYDETEDFRKKSQKKLPCFAAQCHLVSKEGTSQRQHAAKRKQAACCFLRHQGMTTKRIGKSALKRMFKSQELCYSIGEAGRRFLRQLTSIFSTGANGRNISHKHGFKNGWRDISKEELSANMYCIREINLISEKSLANRELWR